MKSERSNVLTVVGAVLHPDTFEMRCLDLNCGHFQVISAFLSLWANYAMSLCQMISAMP
jgi:hypothetical protein